MTIEKILILIQDIVVGKMIEQALLEPGLFDTLLVSKVDSSFSDFQPDLFDVIILSDDFPNRLAAQLSNHLFSNFPLLPVMLLTQNCSDRFALAAIQKGFFDCIPVTISEEELIEKINRALSWQRRLKEAVLRETRKDTNILQNKLNNLQALQRVSSQITSSLDLDQVLKDVVDASVDLTRAEEGSLLLVDEETGELYMRASRNFQEEFVKTFRLPVHDSLVGQVLSSGKPLLLDGNTPRKIVTSYLVHSILYVPLKIENRVIGVLGVDNRKGRKSFSNDDVTLVSALADFAAIAIQNARLFSNTEIERNKLESILTNIEDGVIIIDQDERLTLINRKARQLFGIHDPNISGRRVADILHHAELLELLEKKSQRTASRIEINIEDGRVFYAQLTPIEDIGLVITMQDITNLKELDRIKGDFVNTVSHDLRSPLTAILGYVELIERVGPINDQQREFIRRVQISVHNITSLINDLLDLGRIEAGFDTRKEIVPISPIIHYSVDSLHARAQEKMQTLRIEETSELPQVLGNPVRLRQMLTNLITNAIKYTAENGEIKVTAYAEEEQIIIQIADSGQGIPSIDQPFIFDKFYRAGNVASDTPGTGLGLAIVKSIVENHQGRIWVDSNVGEGSCFTIVLPVIQNQL
jgi:two-component system NtrC family sensor kinase